MTASHATPAPGGTPAEAEGLLPAALWRKATSHTRWVVLAFLFIVTAVNYADRSSMSIAGTPMSKELGISAIQLGYLFSAFGWAYAGGQVPGGWLLMRDLVGCGLDCANGEPAVSPGDHLAAQVPLRQALGELGVEPRCRRPARCPMWRH
jgi:hypothetical protein